MVTELRHLLEESVQHPPAEPHDTHAIVGRARRRRTRQRLGVAGSVLAVALVASGGYAVVHGSAGGDVPVAHTAPVGPVVHLDDASRAADGDQYRLTTSYTNQDLDEGNGRLFTQVTDDGRVVVSDAQRRDPADPMSEYNRYGLVDPATGDTTWLPEPPDAHFSTDQAPSGPSVLTVAGDQVVWVDRGGSPLRIDVYDLGARSWSHLDLDLAAVLSGSQANMRDLRGAAVWDGRLYFVPEDFGGGATYTGTLWSVPLDGSAAPAKVATVGDWAVDDGTLAFSNRSNDPIDSITVRNLATGDEHSFDPLSGDRCNQLGLALSGGRISLTEYCGTRGKVRDDRVHVVTTDGAQVVTLQGSGVEGGGLGSGFVTATSYDDAAVPAGTFVYDFQTRRLSRIGDGAPKFSPGTLAGGSTVVWSTPVNNRHGMRIWAARWG